MTLAIYRAQVTTPRLAALLGVPAAQRLVEAFGGTEELYIPKTAVAEGVHPIATAIGPEAYRRLVTEFGGLYLTVPMSLHHGQVKGRVARALADGASAAEAARRAGCTGRYARRVRADQAPDPDQPRLFD